MLKPFAWADFLKNLLCVPDSIWRVYDSPSFNMSQDSWVLGAGAHTTGDDDFGATVSAIRQIRNECKSLPNKQNTITGMF